MAKATRESGTQTKRRSGSGESQHSHIEYGSTRGNWDRGAATDFAITTVNVPDRLDTQEVRARAAADARLPSVSRFQRIDFARGLRWLIGLAVIGGLAWGAMRIVEPIRAAISPAGIEAQMSKALGVPVSIRDTDLRFTPSPRLVVTDMIVQSGFRLPEVAVHFNWRDALQGLQSASWVLGEARVGPMQLSGKEALALLQSVRRAAALPGAVSVVRFESVEFPDLTLLPGRYEAVIRRGVNEREFNAVALRRLDSDGQADVEITPPTAAGGSARFALFATKWKAPFGPAVVWSEATAQGEFGADSVKVDSYSVGSVFGNLNGAAMLANDGRGWKLNGNLRGPDLNVEDLISLAAGVGNTAEATRARMPLRGVARFNLSVSGSGASVAEALQRAVVSGPVSVDSAVVSGVNLGLAATQGDLGGSGGATRLTDLDFELFGSRDGLAIRGISGKAGGLRVSGALNVDRQLELSGSVRSEVASPRGVASAQVRIGGLASAPKYQ